MGLEPERGGGNNKSHTEQQLITAQNLMAKQAAKAVFKPSFQSIVLLKTHSPTAKPLQQITVFELLSFNTNCLESKTRFE